MSALVVRDLPGGTATSLLVARSRLLRLTSGAGPTGAAANASLLLFTPDLGDRLNVPDTFKAQYSACIRPGMALMSDRGVALATVTRSTRPWHDALGGLSGPRHLRRFGASSYATDANGWRRSARDLVLLELAKYGGGERDLHASINAFSTVGIGPAGELSLDTAAPAAGESLTLYADTDLLVIVATCPHPLAQAWAPAPVRLEILDAGGATPGSDGAQDDGWQPSPGFPRPETRRAHLAAAAVWA